MPRYPSPYDHVEYKDSIQVWLDDESHEFHTGQWIVSLDRQFLATQDVDVETLHVCDTYAEAVRLAREEGRRRHLPVDA